MKRQNVPGGHEEHSPRLQLLALNPEPIDGHGIPLVYLSTLPQIVLKVHGSARPVASQNKIGARRDPCGRRGRVKLRRGLRRARGGKLDVS
jgi:hypothetical protein